MYAQAPMVRAVSVDLPGRSDMDRGSLETAGKARARTEGAKPIPVFETARLRYEDGRHGPKTAAAVQIQSSRGVAPVPGRPMEGG